jgi:hypothetical protein
VRERKESRHRYSGGGSSAGHTNAAGNLARRRTAADLARDSHGSGQRRQDAAPAGGERRLGISDEKQEAEERHARAAELKPGWQTVHLLGRDIPVLAAVDGTLWAEDDGKPASAKSVQTYVARATGPERMPTSFREAGHGVLRVDCPFHDEPKSAEHLFIYLEPPHFHCFGCGLRGTATRTAHGYFLRAGA